MTARRQHGGVGSAGTSAPGMVNSAKDIGAVGGVDIWLRFRLVPRVVLVENTPNRQPCDSSGRAWIGRRFSIAP
jgi:hypothetical protein